MRKFKVGDKVRYTGRDISRIDNDTVYVVSSLDPELGDYIDLEGIDVPDINHNWHDSEFDLVNDVKPGDVVFVRDSLEDEWEEAIYAATMPDFAYPFVAISSSDGIDKEYSTNNFYGYKYMRIDKPMKEVTMDEIAEKFDIPVEQLKIKK